MRRRPGAGTEGRCWTRESRMDDDAWAVVLHVGVPVIDAAHDRQGKLVANLEGNEFTAQQLGDLVGEVLDRSK